MPAAHTGPRPDDRRAAAAQIGSGAPPDARRLARRAPTTGATASRIGPAHVAGHRDPERASPPGRPRLDPRTPNTIRP